MSDIARFLTVDNEIAKFRARRARFVSSGLESLGLDSPLIRGTRLDDYALSNEVAVHLRDSIAGNRGDEADLVTAARQNLKIGAEALTSVASIKAVRCPGLAEDTCMFSEGATVESPSVVEQELLGRAVQVLERTGTLRCFSDSVGVVAVLGTAEPGAPTATWATGGLPYVVHLHLLPRPELIARDLMHEATHTHLNDWLASRDIRLDPVTPVYWSPWKDSKRPLFGFTHSIMAFSMVTAFLATVMAHSETDQSWLRVFHDAERDRLRSCTESVTSALSMLPDELRSSLSDVYTLATA
ncbi:aKG-HExxH-type peptide beta-hydroxylase [Streptomyces silvensis]|uniref:HEXXH motif domain-containing protein n=1 Tax=Streptomyces silvensis TaxID=1765722 RepID=A0A0W7X6Z7_9ACTN|nr:HEXXH motif-containing putative peptide modification protein [Streptomyces silvensis]KUF18655.1 hypothetical protein AT728_06210 [Streptomyces silvensis]